MSSEQKNDTDNQFRGEKQENQISPAAFYHHSLIADIKYVSGMNKLRVYYI